VVSPEISTLFWKTNKRLALAASEVMNIVRRERKWIDRAIDPVQGPTHAAILEEVNH
jgi:hypothetical protein